MERRFLRLDAENSFRSDHFKGLQIKKQVEPTRFFKFGSGKAEERAFHDKYVLRYGADSIDKSFTPSNNSVVENNRLCMV